MQVEGVVLAGGLSSRADAFKMALKIGNKTLIEKCLEGMYDICSRVIVVGGYNIDVVASIVNKYPKVNLIFNRGFQEGMFSSVLAGIREVKEERFFITPGDYPLIGKGIYNRMLDIDGNIVIPVFNEKKGHPVLIKSYLIKELLNGSSYKSLREFIESKGYIQVEVAEEGILTDVDTQEDYKKVLNRLINEKSFYKP